MKSKVRPALVTNLEKAGWFTIPKEKDKDYLTSITKKAAKFIGPNHYKRPDYNLFKTDQK